VLLLVPAWELLHNSYCSSQRFYSLLEPKIHFLTRIRTLKRLRLVRKHVASTRTVSENGYIFTLVDSAGKPAEKKG